ncbi:DNA polymerase III subunit alpha [Pseudactinotalea sp. HY160]|uniref:DNA polymerase III subunit alpha n=1 Tax=Pseudactinotalea sp. HY160 TaxID=2654490 RepID=UPI00128BAFD6|nr:DNA polymerase III subunit alpha [Pseudactinotalea sp. HY160]MPV49873.1 DNA polymerase III subunit alpha [Pseudactinotalea sp. HY160]
MFDYAELHAHSAYSFLDGASLPEELATEAAGRGLRALALTDHNGLYGVVRFAEAARALGLPSIFGAEVTLDSAADAGGSPERTGTPDPGGNHLVLLARGPAGYHRLSRALALGHLATGVKGRVDYSLEGLAETAAGEWIVLTGCRKGAVRRALEPASGRWDLDAAVRETRLLADTFGRGNVYVELTHHGAPGDDLRCAALAEVAARAGVGAVATGAVHCATPADQPLATALAATRARRTLAEIDGRLPAAPAFLRSPAEMARLHARTPGALAATVAIAAETAFDLALVAPNLPPFPVPAGHTETTWLRHLTDAGARERYGPPEAERQAGAYAMLEHELTTIDRLDFSGYFLIVHEIVEFARANGILCQGRGSAANSAVCFALGITAVDAVQHRLLFERFLSPGRSGPPDIDIDIEAGRREEVIQFVYSRYGRHHAAQVANVISYRPRSAIRDAARALGHDAGRTDAWAKGIERWGSLRPAGDPPGASGVVQKRERPTRDGPWTPSPEAEAAARSGDGGDTAGIPAPVLDLAERFLRLPRHLGIHSGGMVICEGPVIDVVPVEWAAKEGRTVIQWDKDDAADAGLVKFDLLGLGMLTALRIAFDTVRELTGTDLDLHSIPQEDGAVYDLLCAADTVGVFQVESRAQMATLPRLRPRRFYDIVVEVALIRPGPIQGASVHPYIERARGREPVTYLHPLLEPALAKTLGVPLFQEQLMQIAIDAAGFTPAEADRLRKAMGSKRSAERMEALRGRLLEGMAERGISRETGAEIFEKLKGFADFGFPESHAFSFAYLVYASAWLKVHHPEAFYAALLAAQPMGFYSPASLVADARRRGVRVERARVDASGVQAQVHSDAAGLFVQLGLAPIRGLGERAAAAVVTAREQSPPAGLGELARRVELSAAQLEALATAGALECFGLSRREALWQAGALAGAYGRRSKGFVQPVLPFEVGTRAPALPPMDEVSTAVADVWASGLSPDSYPTQFLRVELERAGVLTAVQCQRVTDRRRIRVAGVVTHRQRPATARGVTFLSLEDETGLVNVVCPVAVWDRYRRVARTSAALIIRGMVERADGVSNVLAETLTDLPLRVPSRSRDFR